MNGDSVSLAHPARHLARAGLGVIVFLGVGSNAIAVFVVDPEILDGSRCELVAHALRALPPRAEHRGASLGGHPIASASARGSGAYSSIARRANWPSFGTVSAAKSWAPPYTVWTGCRAPDSPG